MYLALPWTWFGTFSVFSRCKEEACNYWCDCGPDPAVFVTAKARTITEIERNTLPTAS